MSSPSPGPGWWLASDDKWYPQQWEYTWEYASGKNTLNDLMHKADALGQTGWEMVSFSYIDLAQSERAAAFFKRPLIAGG